MWGSFVTDEQRLNVNELREVTADVPWDNIQATGISISDEDAAAIEILWAR